MANAMSSLQLPRPGLFAAFLVLSVIVSALKVDMPLGAGGSCLSLSYAATRGMSLPFIVTPSVVFGAFAFSAAVGVVFGFLPARKAALLNPLEALRHE